MENLSIMEESSYNMAASITSHDMSIPELDVPTPTTNKIRDIEIQELNHGFHVRIGCHRFGFTNVADLLYSLNEYIKNPMETENKWFENKLFENR
jgi:hypothetical protein